MVGPIGGGGFAGRTATSLDAMRSPMSSLSMQQLAQSQAMGHPPAFIEVRKAQAKLQLAIFDSIVSGEPRQTNQSMEEIVQEHRGAWEGWLRDINQNPQYKIKAVPEDQFKSATDKYLAHYTKIFTENAQDYLKCRDRLQELITKQERGDFLWFSSVDGQRRSTIRAREAALGWNPEEKARSGEVIDRLMPAMLEKAKAEVLGTNPPAAAKTEASMPEVQVAEDAPRPAIKTEAEVAERVRAEEAARAKAAADAKAQADTEAKAREEAEKIKAAEAKAKTEAETRTREETAAQAKAAAAKANTATINIPSYTTRPNDSLSKIAVRDEMRTIRMQAETIIGKTDPLTTTLVISMALARKNDIQKPDAVRAGETLNLNLTEHDLRAVIDPLKESLLKGDNKITGNEYKAIQNKNLSEILRSPPTR